mmetsp:Transcript_17564/g.38729  ORF Transcript_17564/g.38729 Transcript_17564/m.38729 type:complete len:236 (+) Transcript_17564:101-808(+)
MVAQWPRHSAVPIGTGTSIIAASSTGATATSAGREGSQLQFLRACPLRAGYKSPRSRCHPELGEPRPGYCSMSQEGPAATAGVLLLPHHLAIFLRLAAPTGRLGAPLWLLGLPRRDRHVVVGPPRLGRSIVVQKDTSGLLWVRKRAVASVLVPRSGGLVVLGGLVVVGGLVIVGRLAVVGLRRCAVRGGRCCVLVGPGRATSALATALRCWSRPQMVRLRLTCALYRVPTTPPPG